MLPPHGRAGQIQDDDGPKNELLRNGQPIEDDGYDNPGMTSLTVLHACNRSLCEIQFQGCRDQTFTHPSYCNEINFLY